MICLLLVFVGIYLIPLGIRPLVVPDEARYAAIPSEMIQTGEWTVPHLAGVRYFEKPVLGYWMTAISFLVLGEHAISVRLPSALMSGLTIAMLLLFVRRWTGRWDLAALSGLVLATCAAPVIFGTTALLDAPFAALVTMTVVCFYLGWRSRDHQRLGWLIAAGVACGAAFLVKGFLAIALPGMILVPWLAWSHRWRDLLTLPWIPAAAAAATAIPWSIAVHRAAPEYWDYFFWVEHIQRFAGGEIAQHAEPWWYFIPILVAGLMPWIFAAPLIMIGLARRGFGSAESRLLVCWAILPLIFFSVSSGKLPTYILPCFPPIAAMIAIGLVEYFSVSEKCRQPVHFIPGLVLIGIGAVGVAAAFLLPSETAVGSPWRDGGIWRLAVCGAAFMLWGVADWASCRSDDGRHRVLLGGVGVAALLAVVPSMLPTGWLPLSRAPMAWLAQWEPLVARSTVLADRGLIHAGYWAWPESEVRLFGSPGELRWGVENFEDHAAAHIETSELAGVVATASVERPVLLIATRPEKHQELIGALVDAGSIAEPATISDRDVLLAVWPGGAMPQKD
jgi:4-amino-4-deoxy-L-arabinose transferase